jgi:hypothetical protein
MTFQHKFGQNLNFAVPSDWIASMRTRGGGGPIGATAGGETTQAPLLGNRPMSDTPRELVLGTWSCGGADAARNGQYSYARDGGVTISSGDRKPVSGHYSVSGRAIEFIVPASIYSYTVEEITEKKMVLNTGEGGLRLVCERR